MEREKRQIYAKLWEMKIYERFFLIGSHRNHTLEQQKICYFHIKKGKNTRRQNELSRIENQDDESFWGLVFSKLKISSSP